MSILVFPVLAWGCPWQQTQSQMWKDLHPPPLGPPTYQMGGKERNGWFLLLSPLRHQGRSGDWEVSQGGFGLGH